MIDLREVGRDHADRVLLLDVGVEGVVEETVVRLVHLADDLGRIAGRVERVALEAVERLDRELDLLRSGVFGGLLVHLDDAGALFLGRRIAGEDAERLVERAAENFAAGCLEAVDRPFEVGEAGVADLAVGAGAVVLRIGNDGDRGGAQPAVLQRLADLPVGLRRAEE